MDDALVVRGREAFSELHPEPDNLPLGNWPCFDLFAKRIAGNQLHREKVDAVRTEFENSLDVRMIELRESESFLTKLFASRFVREQAGGKNLQRDIAGELFVMRAIHFAHAARPDFLNHAIVRNHPTGEWRRFGHWRECYAAPSHKSTRRSADHFNLAYSALACCRMGMSGSASFQRVRKSL